MRAQLVACGLDLTVRKPLGDPRVPSGSTTRISTVRLPPLAFTSDSTLSEGSNCVGGGEDTPRARSPRIVREIKVGADGMEVVGPFSARFTQYGENSFCALPTIISSFAKTCAQGAHDDDPIAAMAYSPSTRIVVTVGAMGSMRFWETGQPKRERRYLRADNGNSC